MPEAQSNWHLVSKNFEVPVYYEDTDFSGYVFHPNYLKYFDRAREELIGRDLLKRLWLDGRHFVVKSASQEFTAPARHGDTLLVQTWIEFSQSPLVRFRHEVRIKGDDPSKKPVASAVIELVSVSEKGFPVRLPSVLQDLFQSKISVITPK